jgi:hypothetical protein
MNLINPRHLLHLLLLSQLHISLVGGRVHCLRILHQSLSKLHLLELLLSVLGHL